MRSLTRFLVCSSCWSHFCCNSARRAYSRAVKAFFRAIPAAARTGPWASSFASSWTKVTRYPDYTKKLARDVGAKPEVRSRGRKCTKLVSAAVVSCCSAAPRIVASVDSQCASSCHTVASACGAGGGSFTSRECVQQYLIDVHDGGSRTRAHVFITDVSVDLCTACGCRAYEEDVSLK